MFSFGLIIYVEKACVLEPEALLQASGAAQGRLQSTGSRCSASRCTARTCSTSSARMAARTRLCTCACFISLIGFVRVSVQVNKDLIPLGPGGGPHTFMHVRLPRHSIRGLSLRARSGDCRFPRLQCGSPMVTHGRSAPSLGRSAGEYGNPCCCVSVSLRIRA